MIAKQFYRNLSDLIMEVLKIKNMSTKTLNKRLKFNNYDIINNLHNRNVFVAIGHCGNWEWTGLKIAMISDHKPFAVVKPLTDPFFDKYLSELRTKSGYNNLVRFKQTYRTLNKMEKEKFICIIASDQTPTRDEINYWTNFLNQETPFFLGLEKMSKSLDIAVLFFDIIRIKRGYYEVDIVEITKNPKDTAEYEITDKYVHLLEETIKKHPDNWLWSHRRWKHKKEQLD